MKIGRAVVCAVSLGEPLGVAHCRLVVAWLTMSSQESETSKSELELAYEYSEVLAESEDEDDRMLKALWKSLEETRARRMSQGLFGSSGDGSQPASPVHKPSVAEPATALAVQRCASRVGSSSSSSGAHHDTMGSVDAGPSAHAGPSAAAAAAKVMVVAQPDDDLDPFKVMYIKVDNLVREKCQGSVMTRALDCLAVLDAEQLRAAYGVLILKQQVVVISGPAGSKARLWTYENSKGAKAE